MAVYLLSLLSPTDIGESQETSHACVIFMIWASSVPFLHFQFFHTPLLELTLLFIMTFLSVWFSSFVQFSYMRRDSIAACCLLCAIAMLPAIYAILQPTACRYDMAAEYVKLHMIWLSGAICYTMNLPERLGFFVHSHLSLVAMHIIAATASVAFSAHLLRAFQTTSQFTHLCRVWYCSQHQCPDDSGCICTVQYDLWLKFQTWLLYTALFASISWQRRFLTCNPSYMKEV